MKERPILFSDGMVRSILAGVKRQTRRPVKPSVQGCTVGAYTSASTAIVVPVNVQEDGDPWDDIPCPYGEKGDRLWVREAFANLRVDGLVYRATYANQYHPTVPKWRPSIHMPRLACRLFLEITQIRAQRVQDITEADAQAEGAVEWFWGLPDEQQRDVFCNASVPLDAERELPSPRDCFIMLWDSINKARYPWASNPYVWVIEFTPLGVGNAA
jgi:hypothetical protein